jgi:hypothetical protein
VPASLAVAVRLWELPERLWLRVLTLVVLTLSAWVGLCATVFPEGGFPAQYAANGYSNLALCDYTPDFSALGYPLVTHHPVNHRDIAMIAYCGLVYCYLAAPLARSIIVDVAARGRSVLAGAARGWRW